MTCARTGDVEPWRRCWRAAPTSTRKEPLHDQTALMWAAAQKHPDVVAALIEGRRGRAGALARLHADGHQRGDAACRPRSAELHRARAAAARRCCSPRARATSNRRGCCSRPARDVNDALPNGMTALVEAAHSGQQAVGDPAAREGRGPQRRRGRLHRAARRRPARRPRSREGAARARRRSEPAHDQGHAGPPQQRGLRAAGDAHRRDAVLAGRQVPRGRHHARAGRPPAPTRG